MLITCQCFSRNGKYVDADRLERVLCVLAVCMTEQRRENEFFFFICFKTKIEYQWAKNRAKEFGSILLLVVLLPSRNHYNGVKLITDMMYARKRKLIESNNKNKTTTNGTQQANHGLCIVNEIRTIVNDRKWTDHLELDSSENESARQLNSGKTIFQGNSFSSHHFSFFILLFCYFRV